MESKQDNQKSERHSIVMYPDIPVRITAEVIGDIEDFDANAWVRKNADAVKEQLIASIIGMDIDDIFVSDSDVEADDCDWDWEREQDWDSN